MRPPARRIARSEDLGRTHGGFDILLGSAAVVPFALAAGVVWLAPLMFARPVRLLAVVWAGCLLTFLAGVRRGLTFSEAGGGRWSELATMLGLFCLGVADIVLVSPILGAIGLASVGLLDAVAARRREAPAYFAIFRPVQMGAAVVALLIVGLR